MAYPSPLPAGMSSGELDTLFAALWTTVQSEALALAGAQVSSDLQPFWDAYHTDNITSGAAVLNGDSIVIKNSAGTSVGPGTAVVSGSALASVNLPATKAVLANSASVTVKNSAGTSVGPATAVISAGVLASADFPATKAVLANGDSVVVHDNGGGTNTKSPGVAEIALGVVTDVKLAA